MKTDVTSKAVRGKMKILPRKNPGTFNLRFPNAHIENVEIISFALEKARMESDTEFDSVALTNICHQYLSCN